MEDSEEVSSKPNSAGEDTPNPSKPSSKGDVHNGENTSEHTSSGGDDMGITVQNGDDTTSTVSDKEISNDNNGISHLYNSDVHPYWLRWGLPVYLTCTIVLLLMSDISSGISADQILLDGDTVVNRTTLLEVSIFASVKELWHAKSYVLTVLIVITSIVWPYVKLLFSLYIWIMPPKSTFWFCCCCFSSEQKEGDSRGLEILIQVERKRERFISILDVLGKWSFVDIFVLIIILVAFRTKVWILGDVVSTETVVIPNWGLFGFITASILSLLGTHVILYRHRIVLDKLSLQFQQQEKADNNNESNAIQVEKMEGENDDNDDCTQEDKKDCHDSNSNTCIANESGISKILMIMFAIIILSLHLVGCIVDIYTLTSRDDYEGTIIEEESYSFVSVGSKLVPYASFQNENIGGLRFLQILYFLLGFVIPIINIIMFVVLYLIRFNPKETGFIKNVLFYITEILYSWCCIEVFVISCIITVIQIPTFGNGLIESGCAQCYVVSSSLDPKISIIICSSVLHVLFCFYLYHKAHKILSSYIS